MQTVITVCIQIYRCVLFPHSHLFCGQYIDASTTVYIDPSVFNYTEANNRIGELDNGGILGGGVASSCRWITAYTFCLSVYPHCNNATQALVPPCIDDCMEYSDICGLSQLFVLTTIPLQDRNSLDGKFLLSCSDPFRAFSSTINDTENCFNFSCKLTFQPKIHFYY